MSLNTRKNENITRTLTATIDGKEKPVVTLTGRVIPKKSLMLSLVVSDAELATANHDDITAALDAFVAEVRTLAADNGLPA